MHPFVCLACGKGFKYEHSLNFHIKSYHGPGTVTNSSSAGSSGHSSSISSNNLTKKFSATETSSKLLPLHHHPSSNHNIRFLQSDPGEGDEGGRGEKDARRKSPSGSNQERGEEESVMVSESEDDNNSSSNHQNDNNNCQIKNYMDKSYLESNQVMKSSGQSGNPFGFPPSMFTSSSFNGMNGVKIESEKPVITILEGRHVASDQTYILYKCCLCGFAFPTLDPMIAHVSTMHNNNPSSSPASSFNPSSSPVSSFNPSFPGSSGSGNFSCEKCGATFKWKSELTLHDQLHKAMDSQLNSQLNSPQGIVTSSNGQVQPPPATSSPLSSPSSKTGLNHQQNILMSTAASHPFLMSNPAFAASMLLNPFNFSTTDKLTADHFLLPPSSSSNSSSGNNHRSGSSMSSLLKVSNHNDKNGSSNIDTSPVGQVLNLSMGHPGSSVGGTSAALVAIKNAMEKDAIRTPTESSPSLGRQGIKNGLNRSSELSSREHSRLSLLNDELTKQLMQSNPSVPSNGSNLAIGEIEETAPGQFKCRYCDKTFDRIFSVHRHERVHTGYKPCICKVCGRGFSEKRNLRHHIIRFHSDGSGRELLKRARKDKTLAATTKQLAATLSSPSVSSSGMNSLSGREKSLRLVPGDNQFLFNGNDGERRKLSQGSSHEGGRNNHSSSFSSTASRLILQQGGNNNNEPTCVVDLRSVKREQEAFHGDQRREEEEMDQGEMTEEEDDGQREREARRKTSRTSDNFSTSSTATTTSPPPPTSSHPRHHSFPSFSSLCERTTSPRNRNEDQDVSCASERRGEEREDDACHHSDPKAVSGSGQHRNHGLNGRRQFDSEEDDSEEKIVTVPSSFPSSSRRRKSKPSKKIFVAEEDEEEENHHDDEDDEHGEGVNERREEGVKERREEGAVDEDDLGNGDEIDEEENCSRLRVVEEESNDEEERIHRMDTREESKREGITSCGNRSEDGNLSGSESGSNGNQSEGSNGNQSENSLEGTNGSKSSSTGLRGNHGAFFSSYSPR